MKQKINKKFTHKLSAFFIMLLVTSSHLVIGQGSGEVINLGLYGGPSTDYSWAYSTNRLFSTVETPASIFYSDDSGATWTQPFHKDSLEYITGSTRRGWGGGGIRVVTNLTGWVALQTMEQGGTLTSSVVSYNDGDSSTFHTAYDGYLLHQQNSAYTENTRTSAITISDSWVYVGMENALIRINDTSTYGPHNILFNLDTISSNTNINWLAVSSDPTGYPVLLVANIPNHQSGKLYSYDGTTITEITGTGIMPTHGFERIFIHPADTSLDTLIVSKVNESTNLRKLYRSFNGGTSWTDITPNGFETQWALQNADYSPDWVALMPNSNGLRLSYPGVEASDDFGATWSSHRLPDNASATHPVDTSYVIGSKNVGPQLSSDGLEGTFITTDNVGHSAVEITKIAQKDTDIYYIASKAGLGFTSAYQDPTVTGIAQWEAPFGDFPIAGVGTDSGVRSVAVDPDDELHVIAGATNGFYITTTGPTGFTHIMPTDWDSGTPYDYMITDVKFITSNIIVAVSGTGSNRLPVASAEYGNIWISYDGGGNWAKTVPSDIDGSGNTVDYEQGNAVVVGFGTVDTIIYVASGYWDNSDPKAGGQLWSSDDLGATWSFINYGPTGQNTGTTIMPIYDLDIHPDPDSNEVLYIASGENLDYAFCKTIDGGATYTYLNVAGHGAFSSVLVKISDPVIVSVAARRELFRYNSLLASTTTVFEGLPGEFVPDLETGSTLLATTTGLYKLIEEPGSVTTIWNGDGDWDDESKWSNGIPYEICNAVIETGTVNVNMSGKSFDIDIVPQAALTIANGENLSVSGDLTLMSDETGYASFIDEGSLTITGTVKVERHITSDQWHYITPPISDAKADIFMDLWLEYWDEPTSTWSPITSPTEDLLAGKGYKTWASSGTTGDVTLEFAGTINTGNYSPTITLSGTPEETGWNLVGNDFPSAIDWGTENTPVSGYTRNNIDATIYFWNGSQYTSYNPAGNGTGTLGATQFIPSMQGFYIHANAENPELSIPQESRLHHSQDFRNPLSMNEAISLSVYSANYSDEIIIRVNENATNEFDSQYDAYKLYGINNAPQLYNITEDEILSINNMPMNNHRIDANLGFIAGSPELHTIVASGTDSFNNNTVISLEDIQEDIIINLKTDSIYSYYASPGDDPNRFILHINTETVDIQIFDKPADNLIYLSNKNIVVESTQGNLLNGSISIYDLLGRKQFTGSLDGNIKQVFEPQLPTGAYIVMICNDMNVQTKKIIIK